MASRQVQEDGPTDADVIFGRGNGANYHSGNIRFRQLTLRKVEAYCEARRREHKDELARQLLAEVEQNGGRFLKSVEVSTSDGDYVSVWEVVPHGKVLAKVKQALRDAALNYKRNPGRATRSSSRREVPRAVTDQRTSDPSYQVSARVARMSSSSQQGSIVAEPSIPQQGVPDPPRLPMDQHQLPNRRHQQHAHAMLQKMQYDELTRNQQLIGSLAMGVSSAHPDPRALATVGSRVAPEQRTAPAAASAPQQPNDAEDLPAEDERKLPPSVAPASRLVRPKSDDDADDTFTEPDAKRRRSSSPPPSAKLPSQQHLSPGSDSNPAESVYLPHSPSLSRQQQQHWPQQRVVEVAKGKEESEKSNTSTETRAAETGSGTKEEDPTSRKKRKRFGDRLEI